MFIYKIVSKHKLIFILASFFLNITCITTHSAITPYFPQRARFHRATIEGNTAIIQQFIEQKNCIVYEQDKDGWTLLHKVATWGHIEIVQLLINQNINLNTKNRFGETALHKAAERGHINIVDALIRAGANIHAQDNIGQTPLHEAVVGHYTNIVRVLIEAGANPDLKNKASWTPLHEAAARGYTDIVQLFFAHADLDIKDNKGRTAFGLAIEFGHTPIVNFLKFRSTVLHKAVLYYSEPIKHFLKEKYELLATYFATREEL